MALEKARDKAARELVEANKRRVEISEIKTELEGTRGRLQEKDNANRVLEQTIRRRLPELEGRLKAAKEAMAELEAANNELRNTAGSRPKPSSSRARHSIRNAATSTSCGSLGGRSCVVAPLVQIRRDARQGEPEAERRAVQAQAGADRRTHRRQREWVVARGTRQARKPGHRRGEATRHCVA